MEQSSNTSGRILLLDPHELVINHGVNGRFEPELTPLDDLVQGFLTEGQLQPIVVFKLPDRHYQVRIGNRRTMAARKINELKLSPVKFLLKAVEALPGNSEDDFRENIMENAQRKQLSRMDIALQLRRWIETYHKSKEWCAEFYGAMFKGVQGQPMSRSWVNGHLLLLRLEPAVQRRLHTGNMGWQAARELLFGLKPEEQEQVLEMLQAEGANPTIDNIVKKKRELSRLARPRSRPKSEVIETLNGIAGSPACSEKQKTWIDSVISFFNGTIDAEKLTDLLLK